MIDVLFSSQCSEIMALLNIKPDQVTTTINDRHRGLVNDGLDRIIAVHWFSDDYFVLVESFVSKKEVKKESNAVRFKQVVANLAISLPSSLPKGIVSQDMSMEEILRVVAESFGHPVTCHPDSPPVALYSGAWDRKKLM